MLTHTVLEGFITECNHTLITSNVSKEILSQKGPEDMMQQILSQKGPEDMMASM